MSSLLTVRTFVTQCLPWSVYCRNCYFVLKPDSSLLIENYCYSYFQGNTEPIKLTENSSATTSEGNLDKNEPKAGQNQKHNETFGDIFSTSPIQKLFIHKNIPKLTFFISKFKNNSIIFVKILLSLLKMSVLKNKLLLVTMKKVKLLIYYFKRPKHRFSF